MKNIFVLTIVFILSLQVSAQKLITTINTGNRVEAYSFIYNKTDGAYVYADYDTTSKKTILFTSKGTSKQYDAAFQYYSLFDNEGNVYTYVYNNVRDSVYKYYLLKNGNEVASFDYIGDGAAINNGVIYLVAGENQKSFVAAYDTKTGTITKGKPYDEIYLAYYPEEYFEGEPQGSIGFTKDGKPYYIAVSDNMKFLVIGNTEQKKYSDIDGYSLKQSNNGEFTYIAKSKGTLYGERGNTFVVMGIMEFKSYDYIYGPIIFDNRGNPVYVANDSVGGNLYRSRIVTGDKESETYTGNIYEFKITPSGKIAYVVYSESQSKEGDYIYETFLVIDGTKGKKYNSISMLNFIEGDIPVFIASNKGGKYFIVKNNSIISNKYENIYDYMFLNDGSLAYIGCDYGNYEKQIPDKNYVLVSGNIFGPYDYVTMTDYNTGKYILTDKDEFAFISGKLADRKNYNYKYKVTTGDWESREFDAIDQVKLVNGKVIFVGGEMYDKTNYLYNYSIYIDKKLAADNYTGVINLDYDKASGKVTCIGCKGNSFYLLEFGLK